MKEKFTPTIGVFAGILHEDGELLLRRRSLPEEDKSLISGKTVKKEWELPGGGVEMAEMLAAGNEQGLINALKREVKEELELEIDISLPFETFPVVLSKEISGKIVNDIALLVIVEPEQWNGKPKGDIKWVTPMILEILVEKAPGERLLSGRGKRMHRMALIAFINGPHARWRKQAKEALQEIYSSWK